MFDIWLWILDGSSYAYSSLILIEEETKLQEILDINPVIEEAQEEGDPKKVPNPHKDVCDLD